MVPSNLYKTQFHIESEKYQGTDLLEIVTDKIRESWNSMLIKHRKSNSIPEDFTLPNDFNYQNESFEVTYAENKVGNDIRRVFIQKNHTKGGFFLQEIYLVYLDERIEFTLTLSTTLSLDTIQPSPPTILRSIIFENQSFYVTMYGERIEHMRFIGRTNFEEFKIKHLNNPERRWPLVVFSKQDSESIIFDEWDLAKRLHGFAIPVKMSPAATFMLRELLGDAPHKGGIGVYHPKNTGLEPSLLRKGVIKGLNSKDLTKLVDRLCINSTLKSIDIKKSKAYLFHKQFEAVQRHKTETEMKNHDEHAELIELRVENTELFTANQQLEAHLDYAKQHVEDLVSQINQLKAEIDELTPDKVDEEKHTKTVAEVLENIKDTFGQYVRIFDDAKKSASKSSFTKLNRLEEVLHKLVETVISELNKKSNIQQIKNKVKQKISGVAWGENSETMKIAKFAKQRNFSDTDKRGKKYSVTMLYHITLPCKTAGKPISVYFDICEHPKEVRVGYCGDHLDGVIGMKNH